jgi:hypothetical protein
MDAAQRNPWNGEISKVAIRSSACNTPSSSHKKARLRMCVHPEAGLIFLLLQALIVPELYSDR